MFVFILLFEINKIFELIFSKKQNQPSLWWISSLHHNNVTLTLVPTIQYMVTFPHVLVVSLAFVCAIILLLIGIYVTFGGVHASILKLDRSMLEMKISNYIWR